MVPSDPPGVIPKRGVNPEHHQVWPSMRKGHFAAAAAAAAAAAQDQEQFTSCSLGGL